MTGECALAYSSIMVGKDTKCQSSIYERPQERPPLLVIEAGKCMSFLFPFPVNGDFEDFFAQANS